MGTSASTRGIKSFRDLIAWQKSVDLAEAIYQATIDFLKAETYGLVSQLRRSAVSVPNNIAEGHERNTTGEMLQSLGHARGSRAELETQVILAIRLSFIEVRQGDDLLNRLSEIARLLNGLRSSLKRKL
ncbi:MAG: four helix bundle protein [Pirellulales bacterium]